ncbi:MAG: dTDP-4-dehydrorhamnose 3,5-epimerase [Pseudomonadota bacterium]
MKITPTDINGLLVVTPRIFPDKRGRFLETFQAERYADAGIAGPFVQDNMSRSVRGTLRGLHFQIRRPQAKLVHVIQGKIFDVAVDLRPGSPTFKKYVGVTLSGEDHCQLFIPEGFAHGFCVLSDEAIFAYKCTDYYAPADEGGVLWSDPDIGIAWPLADPIVSEKDAALPRLKDLSPELLPGKAR